MPFLKLDLLTS